MPKPVTVTDHRLDGFLPNRLMQAYARECAIDETAGKKRSDEVIAEVIGCNSKTFCQWRRKLAFHRWLDDTLRADVMGKVGLAYQRISRIAFYSADEKLAFEAAKYLIERAEPADVPAAMLPGATTGPTLIFNIPRPERELEGRRLVIDAIKQPDALKATA